MVTYKVDLTENELKALAYSRAIAGCYWKYWATVLLPLLIPVVLSIVLDDWLEAMSGPVQLVFFGAFCLPWLVTVILVNSHINRRTQACFGELKKQGQ